MSTSKVRKYINENNIEAEIFEHPGKEGLTSKQAATIHKIGTEKIVKTLFFADENGKQVIIIIQGNKKVDPQKIPNLNKARLANPSNLRNQLGYEPGGLPPIALPENITKLVDKGVTEQNLVVGSAGSRHSGIKLKPQDIVNQPNTKVLDLAKKQ